MIEIINKTIQHTEHLEHFVDMMKYLNSIVDIEPEYETLTYKTLGTKVYEVQRQLCEKNKIEFKYEHNDIDCMLNVDSVFVIEVEENLLTNALRYANNRILVSLGIVGDYLVLMMDRDLRKIHKNIYNPTVSVKRRKMGMFIMDLDYI